MDFDRSVAIDDIPDHVLEAVACDLGLDCQSAVESDHEEKGEAASVILQRFDFHKRIATKLLSDGSTVQASRYEHRDFGLLRACFSDGTSFETDVPNNRLTESGEIAAVRIIVPSRSNAATVMKRPCGDLESPVLKRPALMKRPATKPGDMCIPLFTKSDEWTLAKRDTSLQCFPSEAHPACDIGLSRGYTLSGPTSNARIEINLCKRNCYIKGIDATLVDGLNPELKPRIAWTRNAAGQ